MVDWLLSFEKIVRKARNFSVARGKPLKGIHPFDERNIHPRIQQLVRNLFDDGHYTQATFEAFKMIDKELQRLSGSSETGKKLFMQVLKEDSPIIQLNNLSSKSDIDEQEGYKFLFAGSALAIRNPRGHEIGISDSPNKCLDHLSLASMLLRKLEEAGYL